MNPIKYREIDIHKISKLTAKDIWEYDYYKTNIAIENGFDVLIIWESEYNKNKKEVINKCINFLKND